MVIYHLWSTSAQVRGKFRLFPLRALYLGYFQCILLRVRGFLGAEVFLDGEMVKGSCMHSKKRNYLKLLL